VRGREAAGLVGVAVTERIIYGPEKLEGLFGQSACCAEGGALAPEPVRAAAGKVWSARFTGILPFPRELADTVEIDDAGVADLTRIRALLREAGLPDDIHTGNAHILVARIEGRVIGGIGMEVRGADALFRSLVVAPAARGLGIGRRLCRALVGAARARGVRAAYLLTTTIEPLAERWGFRRIERTQVPAAIQDTSEFRGACCASAVSMWRDLST
jgi:amino-acid N-acetyltransferase